MVPAVTFGASAAPAPRAHAAAGTSAPAGAEAFGALVNALRDLADAGAAPAERATRGEVPQEDAKADDAAGEEVDLAVVDAMAAWPVATAPALPVIPMTLGTGQGELPTPEATTLPTPAAEIPAALVASLFGKETAAEAPTPAAELTAQAGAGQEALAAPFESATDTGDDSAADAEAGQALLRELLARSAGATRPTIETATAPGPQAGRSPAVTTLLDALAGATQDGRERQLDVRLLGATATGAPAWRTALASLVSDATATSSPTASVLPESTIDQIVQSMRLQVKDEIGEAHIRLDPKQFGDMRVSLRVDDGQVVARVQADNASVRDWLQGHQHVLRQSLADQGLTLSRLDVQEPDDRNEDGDAQQRQSSARDTEGESRRRRRQDTPLFEVVA